MKKRTRHSCSVTGQPATNYFAPALSLFVLRNFGWELKPLCLVSTCTQSQALSWCGYLVCSTELFNYEAGYKSGYLSEFSEFVFNNNNKEPSLLRERERVIENETEEGLPVKSPKTHPHANQSGGLHIQPIK